MPRRRRRQIPLASFLCAVLTLAAGSVGVAQSPGPDVTAPAIDVSRWAEHVMPFLGYTVRLPLGFERVGADPALPVRSSASIVDRDPQTGEALSAAAQRIHDNGGLFDAFGLWSIDPGPLLQLGILAGQPYRVGAGELRDIVEQSVLERASELEDPVVEAISVPAGNGFLVVYLDATDLAQHREVHLRTPTGRYLVLATTLPGLADDSIAQTVEAIAGSLRPIRYSAADLATPIMSSADSADAALEATLPERVGGVILTRRSIARIAGVVGGHGHGVHRWGAGAPRARTWRCVGCTGGAHGWHAAAARDRLSTAGCHPGCGAGVRGLVPG